MIVHSLLRPIKPHVLIKSGNLRHAGAGHGMEIYPSNLNHFRAKNLMHAWIATPMIICGLAAGYKDITEGEAMLADTPPGYKPYYWEYEKFPATRWVTKTFRRDPNLAYERMLFALEYLAEKDILRQIDNQVTLLMKQKRDTFSIWNGYHTAKYSRIARGVEKRLIEKDRIHPNAHPNFAEDP